MGLGTSHAYPTISDVLHAAPQLRCIDVTGNKFRAVVDKKFPTLLHNVTELAVTLPANHGVDAFVRFARTLKRLRTLWIRLSKDGNTALVSSLLRMMIPGVRVCCHKKLRLWDREKVFDSYGTDKVVQCASSLHCTLIGCNRFHIDGALLSQELRMWDYVSLVKDRGDGSDDQSDSGSGSDGDGGSDNGESENESDAQSAMQEDDSGEEEEAESEDEGGDGYGDSGDDGEGGEESDEEGDEEGHSEEDGVSGEESDGEEEGSEGSGASEAGDVGMEEG